MFHPHGIGGAALIAAPTVYALSDLHILHLYWGETDALMYRDWAPYADGHLLFVIKCKYLTKGAHIQPCFTGLLRVGGGVLDGRCSFTETVTSVITPVGGLDEHSLPQVLHPVAQLAFDAHIAHLPQTVVVAAGAVAVSSHAGAW